MTNRAYSLLTVKDIDEERRTITGIASTPTPDRMGDIVEPLGAVFKTPMPFLLYHDNSLPVGTVDFAKPTKAGIPFTATIPIVSEPGVIQDRTNEAWHSLKYKLIGAVSIGFRALQDGVELLKTGGLRFTSWEWLELSLVAVPAQADAVITSFKSLDSAVIARTLGLPNPSDDPERAALIKSLGQKAPARTVKLSSVPDPKPNFSLSEHSHMNTADQIKQFQTDRETKNARLEAIMVEAGKEGSTLNAEQEDEFELLSSQIKTIDTHLGRLNTMAALAKAKPVDQKPSTDAAAASREFATVKAGEKLEPGILFARHAMAVFAAKGNMHEAANIARTHYGEDSPVSRILSFTGGRSVETMLKAAVNAGTTINDPYAKPLVEYNNYSGDFVEFLRSRTIIGQFGQNGVPALRQIPFNVHIKGQTAGGTGYWVGEGKPKPVTAFGFNDVYHGWFKVAAIAVLTDELIRFSDPSAELYVRDSLADCLQERMDESFIDPAFAGAANVSPASITNGITGIASSGDTAADVRADINALWALADTANNPMNTPVYITTPKVARSLAAMQNPLGQPEFPGVTARGGSLGGVPLIVSNYVSSDTAGALFILVNASDVYLSDDGQATVDFSNQASIQMLDNPTNDSTNGTATSLVSMFQTDSTALRAHRFCNWSRRRNSGVAYLTGVNWGA